MSTDTTPVSSRTVSEVSQLLNGFDEVAVAKEFKADLAGLKEKSRTLFLRALIFVDLRRDGAKDAAAYKAAMEVRTMDLPHYFQPEPEEAEGEGEALPPSE